MRKTREQATKAAAGFTLVEVMVSLFIFTLITVGATGLYVSTATLESQAGASRMVQQNGSYLLEQIGKEVRNGEINYASYASDSISISGPVSTLRLFYRGTYYQEEIYRTTYTDSTGTIKGKVVLEKQWRDSSGSIHTSVADLTDQRADVESLQFYITPECVSASVSCRQPSVTVAVKMSALTEGGRGNGVAESSLQSTFSTRIYKSN